MPVADRMGKGPRSYRIKMAVSVGCGCYSRWHKRRVRHIRRYSHGTLRPGTHRPRGSGPKPLLGPREDDGAASRGRDRWKYLGDGLQFDARNISHIHAQRSFARIAWLATAGDAETDPRHRCCDRQRHECRLAASLYAPEAFQG